MLFGQHRRRLERCIASGAQNFNKHAGTKLEVDVANFNALAVIGSGMSRICALVCNRGSRVQGNRCEGLEAALSRKQ